MANPPPVGGDDLLRIRKSAVHVQGPNERIHRGLETEARYATFK